MTTFEPPLQMFTSTAAKTAALPHELRLEAAYPNPFNPLTTMQFGLPEATEVLAEVYDATGRRVEVLLPGQSMAAGWHKIRFEAGDLPSGVYLMHLQAGASVETTHVMLVQ